MKKSKPRIYLSVDLEMPSAAGILQGQLSQDQAVSLDRRLPMQFQNLLNALDALQLKATFFVQGAVARRYPELLDEITARKALIACHSDQHLAVSSQSRAEFEHDLSAALHSLKPWLPKPELLGYRAPSFSLSWQAADYWRVLLDKGFTWTSCQMRSRLTPLPAPKELDHVRPWTEAQSGLREFPLGGLRFAGFPLSHGGGFWLRGLPLWWNLLRIRQDLRAGRLVQTYLHPWEFDPGQPRVVRGLRAIRHYRGQADLVNRLKTLCTEFQLVPLEQLVKQELPRD